MKKITLDFENISGKEEMHKYLAEKFEFPDYYGGNLDALFECLTDIAEPTAVNIVNAINDYDEQIINVITAAEEEKIRLGAMISRLTQLAVIDLLVSNLALKYPDEVNPNIFKTFHAIS